MSSTWFRGGLDAVHQGASRWGSSATLRAAAVGGAAIAAPDKTLLTLADFLLQNGTVGQEAAIPSGSSRGVTFDGIDSLNFWFVDQLEFGTVGAGTQVAGVVYYEGNLASPASAQLWLCQDNNGGPFTTPGGTLKWGSAGQNVAAQIKTLESAGRYTFQGTLDFLETDDAPWYNIGDQWKIGYALVRNTTTQTPLHPWRRMSELPGTVVFCTGAGPGATNMPVSEFADRIGPAFNLIGSANNYEFGIKSDAAGRDPITWPNADLTPGEVVSAVLAFAYQGAYSAANAYVLHWDDVVDHTILAAQDITYMQATAGVLTQILV